MQFTALLVHDMHVVFVVKFVMWCCITKIWEYHNPSASQILAWLIDLRTSGILPELKDLCAWCFLVELENSSQDLHSCDDACHRLGS